MTDCILHNKSLDRDRYPRIVKTKNYKRTWHRLAKYLYEQRFGRIEKGKVVDHLCRNRRCINIEHLEIVTIAENTRRGNSAKLTLEIVLEIKKLYYMGIKQTELAKRYSVCQPHISDLVNSKNWRVI